MIDCKNSIIHYLSSIIMPTEPYIIEFHSLGNSVKVTAIDPVSGKEATIVGDPKATKDHLMRLAVKKLEYVMRKS